MALNAESTPMKILINTATQRPVTRADVNLKCSLLNGQAFQWSEHTNAEDRNAAVFYRGVLEACVVTLQYDAHDRVQFSQYPSNVPDAAPQLNDYFQLGTDISALCDEWRRRDTHFARVHDTMRGLRILRQDPLECMVSFLCSQNNNIARITQILAKIRQAYGVRIGNAPLDGADYYTFPTLKALARASEKEFRDLGLGYRAPYLHQLVRQVEAAGGREHLLALRTRPYEEVKQELLKYMGIGSKVADCICLFSLDQTECIPVDTHVHQIYHKVYQNKEININPKNYEKIGDFFRKKFVRYAGWAHSYLFTADLAAFKIPDLKGAQKSKKSDQKAPPKKQAALDSEEDTLSSDDVAGSGAQKKGKAIEKAQGATQNKTSNKKKSTKKKEEYPKKKVRCESEKDD